MYFPSSWDEIVIVDAVFFFYPQVLESLNDHFLHRGEEHVLVLEIRTPARILYMYMYV